MGISVGRNGMMMAMAVMSARGMLAAAAPEVKVMDYDAPSQPMRGRAPSGGRTYKSNGKRETERRRRKLALGDQ